MSLPLVSINRHENSTDTVLNRLAALHPKAIDMSLERVWRLLQALNHPETALPPVIHVAGTNGKGSVVAYLRAFLEAAGFLVHAYTSPHLIRFNERIRVAGQLMDDSALLALLEEVERLNAGKPVTFFEITTCAAFLAFAQTRADVVLLETGLGGRLDATNVLKHPILTVLTPIAMDHAQYLGDHLEAITAEKAHILKPGVGCISAKQDRKVATIIELRSLEVGAPVWREGREWQIRTHKNKSMIFEGLHGALHLPLPALSGNFQVRNAGLAIAAVERLPFCVTAAHIAAGLQMVEWPGRLQRLIRGSLVEGLPTGWEVWIDGGHNPAAADALARHVRNWRDIPLALVVGMLATKDAEGFLRPLLPRVAHIRTVTIPRQSASLGAEALAALAVAQGHPDAQAAESVTAAVAGIVAHYRDRGNRTLGRILVAGSIYLVGTVLAENGELR
ncbi:Dihydrofolate synthase @ Folylpolyglutamate synthase [invertebrate metagenome]|uniref:tetrahydrofolate synthase n=1 Tax=invertebrate metagenome TaxID=1711999 RepID=A0A484H5Y6_9ZZZZ